MRSLIPFLIATVIWVPSWADEYLVEDILRTTNACLVGEFQQQRLLSALPLPLVSSGYYKFCSATGLYWVTTDPFYSELFISDEGIFDADGGSQLLGGEQFAGVFLGLFSGNFDAVYASFDTVVLGETSQWEMHLRPKSELVQKHLDMIELAGGAFTESIVISGYNGDKTRISLQPQAPNVLTD